MINIYKGKIYCHTMDTRLNWPKPFNRFAIRSVISRKVIKDYQRVTGLKAKYTKGQGVHAVEPNQYLCKACNALWQLSIYYPNYNIDNLDNINDYLHGWQKGTTAITRGRKQVLSEN